jgi:hypothetical protein
MFRQSGHHRIMEAPKSPRNNGFRCGSYGFFSTNTSESTASQTELEIADDDLSWWSCLRKEEVRGGGRYWRRKKHKIP